MIKLLDILNEALNQQQIVDVANEFISSKNYNPNHDCKRSTFEFVKYIKKNKGFEPNVLLLAPPKDIKKFPGKSKDGDSHIFAIIDGFGIDFTANQFPGVSESLKITPESKIPSEYKKIGGYYTLYPDWFENGKTSLKTKFNNLPQWFRDGFEKEGFKPELNEADPKIGTGKKPKRSSRRLYTDEDPKDTVSIKFKTVQDIKDTLSKESFKSKPHVRQSQIINLIHQRVRAAYQNANDPETKKRLKRGLDYIENEKEKSKEKTIRLQKEGETINRKNLDFFDLVNKGIIFVTEPFSDGKKQKSNWDGDSNIITLWNLKHPEQSQEWVFDAVKYPKPEAIQWWNDEGQFTLKDEKYHQILRSIELYNNSNKQEQNESELTEKCWRGYTQKGFKTMFGKRYPNCVKK